MKRLIPTAVLASLLVIPGLSWAGGSLTIPSGFVITSLHSRCVSYARTAVGQNAVNLRHRCRFRGAAWSSSLNHHYRWCRGVHGNPVRLRAMNRGRARALARCRAAGGLRDRCRRYARVSVRQNQENRRRRCGLAGPRWSSSLGYHYGWCYRRRVPAASLSSIIRRRARALARCGARPPRPPRPMRQGFTFPRWAGDFLDWCLSGAASCGQATADAFCRRQGYTRAEAFRGPWSTPSRTRNMLTNQACTTPTCQGFYFINCVR